MYGLSVHCFSGVLRVHYERFESEPRYRTMSVNDAGTNTATTACSPVQSLEKRIELKTKYKSILEACISQVMKANHITEPADLESQRLVRLATANTILDSLTNSEGWKFVEELGLLPVLQEIMNISEVVTPQHAAKLMQPDEEDPANPGTLIAYPPEDGFVSRVRDGDSLCLFNAMSCGMFGTELLAGPLVMYTIVQALDSNSIVCEPGSDNEARYIDFVREEMEDITGTDMSAVEESEILMSY